MLIAILSITASFPGGFHSSKFDFQVSCQFKVEAAAFVKSNGMPEGEWLSRDMAGYSYIKIDSSNFIKKNKEPSGASKYDGWSHSTSKINGRYSHVADTQTVFTRYEGQNLREVITILDMSDSDKGSLATLTRYSFGDAALEEFPGYAPLVENGVGRCWLRR